MSDDNEATSTYDNNNDFSEDLKQVFNAEITKLDPLNVTPSIFTLSDQHEEDHHDIVNIPPTIPAKNDTEQNIGDVETTNDTPI